MAAVQFAEFFPNILILLLCSLITISYQDDPSCNVPEYRPENSFGNIGHISLLNCPRVKRNLPLENSTLNVKVLTEANNATGNTSTTSMPPIQTTYLMPPVIEKQKITTEKPNKTSTESNNVKLPQKNLGENGTGILIQKCGVLASSSTSFCVSEPIDPMEGNNATDLDMDEFSESQDKLFKDHSITKIMNDTHEFYNSSFTVDKEAFDNYWQSIENISSVQVNNLLSHSYRRAKTVRLMFDFPFYGYYVKNVTVATGGFIYIGEYLHNWIAATQYIAPLMANFDTTVNNDSYIKHMCNGTSSFTVVWENVFLQENSTSGVFTFATTLYANGDIVFAYKTIPIPIESINETRHPVKVGLSDAFIVDAVTVVRQKTIFEYHKVDFKSHNIVNNTVITLTALPTCQQYNSCSSCVQHHTGFKCSWCPNVQRCSQGYDRQRQEWIVNSCESTKASELSECPDMKNVTEKHEEVKMHSVEKQLDSEHKDTGSMSTIGIVLSTIIIVGAIGSWFIYAFRNPHTNSGQLLIKYRPSQWSWRRGEARYTAATIHM